MVAMAVLCSTLQVPAYAESALPGIITTNMQGRHTGMASLMKGNVWHERCDAKKRNGDPVVTYPVMVEDKHDEIRCHVIVHSCTHAKRVEYLSYAGKPLANMQQFDHVWINVYRSTGISEFDLGFECNGNFNDSYRWVRSTKGIPLDLVNAPHKFYVFGVPGLGGTIADQVQYRSTVANAAWGYNKGANLSVRVPQYRMAYSSADVEHHFTRARTTGLEGVMVKQHDAMYERKRTDGWLKMKPEAEADGIIVGFNEAVSLDGVPLGRAGSVIVRCADDSTAQPSGIKHDLAKHMWENQREYMGRWCEFKFMERDRQGGYRHPTFHRIREDK